MALLNDILKWSENLPMWQRDACRRLLQKEDGLEVKDYVELYALFRKENGIEITEGALAPGLPRVCWVHPRYTHGVLIELIPRGFLKEVERLAEKTE